MKLDWKLNQVVLLGATPTPRNYVMRIEPVPEVVSHGTPPFYLKTIYL